MKTIFLTLLAGGVAVFANPAMAWTLHVRNNAADSTTCGPAKDPCRSISQAIRNAASGDRIIVGPGEYGDHEFGSPPFAIVVDKQLLIISQDGAAATIINVRDTGRWPVEITASHATFGKPGHGFTMIANAVAPFSGLFIHDGTSNVVVEGNVAVGFGRGIDVAGNNGTIAFNVATGNGEGLNIHGNNNVAAANMASGNFGGGGILVGGTGQVIAHNVCNTNTFTGIRVASGIGHRIKDNATLGNGNEGVSLDFPSEARVTGNNLYGTANRCGMKNNNNVGIVATGNFWGAPSGPGPAPADEICNLGAATTNTEGFLRKEADIDLRLELETGDE